MGACVWSKQMQKSCSTLHLSIRGSPYFDGTRHVTESNSTHRCRVASSHNYRGWLPLVFEPHSTDRTGYIRCGSRARTRSVLSLSDPADDRVSLECPCQVCHLLRAER